MHTLQTDLLECKTKNIIEYIDAISTFPKAIDESSSNIEESQQSEISTSTLNPSRPELNQTHTLFIPSMPGVINSPITKSSSNPSTRSISRSRGSNISGKPGRASALRPSRGTRGKRGQNPRPKNS